MTQRTLPQGRLPVRWVALLVVALAAAGLSTAVSPPAAAQTTGSPVVPTDLESLEVRNPLGGVAPMSPDFDPATTGYRAWVPNDAGTVAVVATPADSEAVVTVSDGTDTVTGTDAEFEIGVGVTTLTVTVEDPYSTDAKSYAVAVNRAADAGERAVLLANPSKNAGTTVNKPRVGQKVVTGPNAGGYLFEDVQIRLEGNHSSSPTTADHVQLWTGAGNRPQNMVANLENPSSFTNSAFNTFTAPANTVLEPNTAYWIVVNNSGLAQSQRLNPLITQTRSALADSAVGWRFAESRAGNNWQPLTGQNTTLRLRVRGYALMPPATAATLVASVAGESLDDGDDARAQCFRTGSMSGGYMLTEVRLKLESGNAGRPTDPTYVQLWEAGHSVLDGGHHRPATRIADLENPSSFADDSFARFAVPGGENLTQDRHYCILVNNNGADPNLRFALSNSKDEVPRSLPGWTVEDRSLSGWTAQGYDHDLTRVIRMNLQGYPNEVPPDASLASMVVRGEDGRVLDLAPAFDAASSEYAVVVDGGQEVELSVETTSDTASVVIGGDDDPSTALEAVLDVSSMPLEVPVSVTAYDGLTTRRYTVVLYAPDDAGAGDATLSALGLSVPGGDAVPTVPAVFDPAVPSYWAQVGADVEAVLVRWTAADAGALVTVAGSGRRTSEGFVMALAPGRNEVAVTVVSTDGTVRSSYVVSVTRAAAASSVLVSNHGESHSVVHQLGDEPPGHTRQEFTTGSNPGGYVVTSVGVWVHAEDLGGSETVTAAIYEHEAGVDDVGDVVGRLVTPDSFSDDALNQFAAPESGIVLEADTKYLLAVEGGGDSAADFEVSLTEADAQTSDFGWTIADGLDSGSTTFTSSLRMSLSGAELESGDSSLSALAVTSGSWLAALSPEFDPAVTWYRLTAPARFAEVTVDATEADAGATVATALGGADFSATTALAQGENRITVTVTAENGTETVYTLIVTREAPLEAAFENLPDHHDGSTGFDFDVRFSAPVAVDTDAQGLAILETFVFNETGSADSEFLPGYSVVRLEITPASVADVTVVIPPTTDCEATGAICTAAGTRFAGATVTVPGPPKLSITGVSVSEGDIAALTVTLSYTWDAAVSVEVSTSVESGDSATLDAAAPGGADFTETTTTITIASGSTTAEAQIATGDDETDEFDETFTVSLGSPTGAVIGDGTATVTIIDDDDPPQAIFYEKPADEGDVGATVRLTAASAKPISFDWYATTMGVSPPVAVHPDDYTPASGTVTIDPGDVSGDVAIEYIDDALDEHDESFEIRTRNLVNIDDVEAETFTIRDNDPLPSLSVADAQAGEGRALVFTVSLSAVSGRDVSVAYSAAGITATAGDDFTAPAASATLTILAGQASDTIRIPTAVDGTDEGDGSETLALTLSNPDYATLDTATATGTILDAAPPGLVITPPAVSVEENATATYEVALATEPAADVTVSVLASSLSGTDVTVAPASRTFTPADWEQPQSFTVSADDDADSTGDTVRIQHTTASDDGEYHQLAVPEVTVTVNDDDTPAVVVSDTSLAIGEGASDSYTLVLSTEPITNVNISLSIAPPGAGKVTLSIQSIQFTTVNWSMAQTVTVTGAQDSDKADETVAISHTVSGGADYNEIEVDAVTVTVADDDKSVPGPPAQFTATGGNSEVTLSWAPPDDDGGHPVTGYEVRVDGAAWSAADAPTRHTVTGLANDVEYEFEVRARNTLGGGDPAGPVAATPVGLVAPTSFRVVGTAPSGGTYTVTAQRVALDWDLPTDAVGQRLTRTWLRPGHTCPDSVDATPDHCPEMILYEQHNTTNTGFTDLYVAGGTYRYTARAINTTGDLGSPAHITVIVPELEFTPAAPRELTAATRRRFRVSTIDVDWQHPAVTNDYLIPAYLIQWRSETQEYDTDPTADRSIINAHSGRWMWGADGQYRYNYAATSAIIPGLRFDTQHWIRVGTCATASCDDLDAIAFAAEITIRTIPDPS